MVDLKVQKADLSKLKLRCISPSLSSAGGVRKFDRFVAMSVWQHSKEGNVGRLTLSKQLAKELGVRKGDWVRVCAADDVGHGWYAVEQGPVKGSGCRPLRVQTRVTSSGKRVESSTLWCEYRLDRGDFPFSEPGYMYATAAKMDRKAKRLLYFMPLPERKCPLCGGKGYAVDTRTDKQKRDAARKRKQRAARKG